MSARAHCQLNRRRRIVKADICDRHHLPVRAGDKRRQSALFFNGLLGHDTAAPRPTVHRRRVVDHCDW